MERGAWQTTVHGVANSQDMTEHAHTNVHTHIQRNNFVLYKETMERNLKI